MTPRGFVATQASRALTRDVAETHEPMPVVTGAAEDGFQSRRSGLSLEDGAGLE